MIHELAAVIAPQIFGSHVWVCTCGHRSWSKEAHIDHVEIEPHPVVRDKQ